MSVSPAMSTAIFTAACAVRFPFLFCSSFSCMISSINSKYNTSTACLHRDFHWHPVVLLKPFSRREPDQLFEVLNDLPQCLRIQLNVLFDPHFLLVALDNLLEFLPVHA